MRRWLAVLTVLVLGIALIPMAAMAAVDCDGPYTPIYEIQGDGPDSPSHGDVVTTKGVVTVDLQKTSEQRGFFLQDLDGDGNDKTSDGIFVYHQDTWSPVHDVSVGDVILVTGEVDEQFGRTQIERVSSVEDCGIGTVDAVDLEVRELNKDPERFEGMLVSFTGDLYVSDTYNVHRYGDIWVSAKGVTAQPTNVHPGGSNQMHNLANHNMDDVVMFGDGSRYSSPSPVPFLSGDGTLRNGDVTTDAEGAIFYDFGNYKLVNNPDPTFSPTNSRGPAPDVGGDVVVASFNVLNYWTTLGGRGASTPAQLAVQQEKLVAAIRGMGADIVGLQEIENDDPADVPIATLVAALNTAEGSDVWSRIDGFEQNVYPIVNEIIFRNDRVVPVGDAMTLVDSAFDDFRFPGDDPNDQLGRRPVAQAFEYDGSAFTVVVNHFKSKSTTGATGPDLNQNDGQSGHNARRVMQAQAVLDWIPYLQAESSDDDVLVIGDLNAYLNEDPIRTLEEGLRNILKKADNRAYSYVYMDFRAAPFIGRGTLDHALATSSMSKQVSDVDVWHINADEPRFLDWYDPTTFAPGPYRSSDHDPVLIGLDLKG